jgi:hemerythrin-like domain-containing protein
MADRIADADRRDEACIVAVSRFLQEDFGVHIIDEDEDLFPLLRRRAAPDDGIEAVLCDLSEEHASDRLDATEIIEGLSVNRSGPRPTERLRDLLHRFADSERHHLIVENAIVLPLARARLTVDDLRNLGRRMASRRGVDFPDKSG